MGGEYKIINSDNNLIKTKQSAERKKISFDGSYLKTASSIVKNRLANSLKRAIEESKSEQQI